MSPDWEAREEYVMHQACQKKFHACSYAHEALLSSKSELVEGTFNLKWGSGLDPKQTLDCLPDYWPGENKMGRILKDLCSELLEVW